jgi:hypothetical protein
MTNRRFFPLYAYAALLICLSTLLRAVLALRPDTHFVAPLSKSPRPCRRARVRSW